MESVIIRVAESVEIRATPSAVFRFLNNPLAKAQLNPFVQVIRIEREDPGPLREGSVTFFRLQKGTRIFEYRTRCLRVEPDRLLESQADLATLFRVRVELEPVPGGTRLTQQEECEVALEMLEGLPVTRRTERAWRFIRILNLFAPSMAREAYAVILQERCDTLRSVLQRELRAWLQAIQRYLEAEA